jgi:hypothetical protein
MKISELIEILKDVEKNSGDLDVVVQAAGGIAGSVVDVVEANEGFDWTHDKFVIYLERPLLVQSDMHKEIRRARAQIANAMMRSLKHGGPASWVSDLDFQEGTKALRNLEPHKWNKKKVK